MDRFEQLVSASQVAVCVLGNPDARDFCLVNVNAVLTEDEREDITRRALHFCGVICIVDGATRTELAEPLESEAIDIISSAFVGQAMRIIAARLDRLRANPSAPTDDFVAFAESLFALPDNRT